MSKKSTPVAPSDVPPDPSRLDLLETKLDKVLAAIGTLSATIGTLSTKLDTHVSKSSEDLLELDSRMGNTYEDLLLQIRDLSAPKPPSLPLTDTVAQTIYNCSFPSSPCLSHHPTDVIQWLRANITRKAKSSNPSTTFHYDTLQKYSPEVFKTLLELARLNLYQPDYRFPQTDDDFYHALLTTIFWDKSYDNLVSLFQAISPATTDSRSNHIFICGVQSLVTMLPQHLSQYDIKHIITAVRKFLSSPLQRIFDGNCTTITSLSHLIPALLKSLNDNARLPNTTSHPHTQSFSDRSDRPFPPYHPDRVITRDQREPRHAETSPKIPNSNSDRTSEAPRPHRINHIALANHPKTVTLDPATFVSICENCDARNDHDTFECPNPCQSMECSSKLVLPHAHKDCPWFGAEFDQF